MLLSERVRNLLVGFFALMLLLVFIVIYALTFWLTLSGTYESFIGNDNDFFHSFSTTLVGLVGGIVALALGQQSAPRSRRRSSTRHANDNLENQTGGEHEYLVTVEQWREYLAIAYVLAYFILGLIAVAVWIFAGTLGGNEGVPDQVKSLAGIVGALFIPLVGSFFGVQGYGSTGSQ